MSRAIFEALSGGKTILDAADSAADNTIVVPVDDNKFVWGLPTYEVNVNKSLVQNIGW